jgi:hypothetical protein
MLMGNMQLLCTYLYVPELVSFSIAKIRSLMFRFLQYTSPLLSWGRLVTYFRLYVGSLGNATTLFLDPITSSAIAPSSVAQDEISGLLPHTL